MRAAIREYECYDSDDLSTYNPEEPQVFGFTLAFSIGVEGQTSSDLFEVLVASAPYLAQRYPEQAVVFLRHIILASDYNVNAAVALMNKFVSSLEGSSWQELAIKISAVARWEYEDYRPGS